MNMYLTGNFLLLLLAFISAESEFYKFNAYDINGEDEINMNKYKNKVVLIVNVASECGFTDNHYRELVDLQKTYHYDQFVVLGFPCNQFGKQEPKQNKYILDFAEKTYQVNFQMFAKIKTKGEHAHPLFKWLKKEMKGKNEPTWNFCKYLLNRKGKVVRFASSMISPMEMEKDIKKMVSFEELDGDQLIYEERTEL